MAQIPQNRQFQEAKVPSHWGTSERRYAQSVNDLFERLFYMFGRLSKDDLSKPLNKEITDATGNISTLEQTAQGLQTSVTNLGNTKNRTYINAIAPSVGLIAGDLWIDSANGNLLKRYNGSAWAAVQDGAISIAQQQADKIQWLVASGTSAANMTLTSQLYSLMAANIDLSANNSIKLAVGGIKYGPNLIPHAEPAWTNGSFNPSNGVRTIWVNDRIHTIRNILLKPDTKYTLSRYGQGQVVLYFYDNSGSFLPTWSHTSWITEYPFTFQTPSGAPQLGIAFRRPDDSPVRPGDLMTYFKFTLEEGERPQAGWSSCPDDRDYNEWSNILPADQGGWEQGSFDPATGNTVLENTRLRNKYYQPINGDAAYTLSQINRNDTAVVLYFYDSGMNFIPSGSYVAWITAFPFIFTTPPNAVYFRAGVRKADSAVTTVDEIGSLYKYKIAPAEGASAVKTSKVTIDGTGIAMTTGGTFTTTSQNFNIDAAGNVVMKGTVEAASGKIGGFDIGATAIYKGKPSLIGTQQGIYLGTDGIALGDTSPTSVGGIWLQPDGGIFGKAMVFKNTTLDDDVILNLVSERANGESARAGFSLRHGATTFAKEDGYLFLVDETGDVHPYITMRWNNNNEKHLILDGIVYRYGPVADNGIFQMRNLAAGTNSPSGGYSGEMYVKVT